MAVQTLERPPELPPPPDPAPPATADSGSGPGGRRGWRRKLVTVVAIASLGIASLGIGSGLAGGYVATGLEDAPAATIVGMDTDGGSLGDAIQTDASISPGNSGGPLVNAAGQVVNQLTDGGVHTVSASTSS